MFCLLIRQCKVCTARRIFRETTDLRQFQSHSMDTNCSLRVWVKRDIHYTFNSHINETRQYYFSHFHIDVYNSSHNIDGPFNDYNIHHKWAIQERLEYLGLIQRNSIIATTTPSTTSTTSTSGQISLFFSLINTTLCFSLNDDESDGRKSVWSRYLWGRTVFHWWYEAMNFAIEWIALENIFNWYIRLS